MRRRNHKENCALFRRIWFDDGDMGIHLLSAGHSSRGLDEVAAAAAAAPGILERHLADGTLDGGLLLSTCNRVELLVESAEVPSVLLAELPGASLLSGIEAAAHLFRVASGLDSMVVGEREIVGQVRRAADAAARAGTLTPALSRLVQSASAASKRVAAATALTGRGRSIVEIGLSLAEETLGDLRGARAVLIGTGSYAGASVAALRDRGVSDIAVHSASGRAEAFSRGHGTRALGPEGLAEALAGADLLLACRGTGQPVLDGEDLLRLAAARAGRPLVLLDLALRPDLAPGAPLPAGLVRIDLDAVSSRLPEVASGEVEAAERIVADAVLAYARESEGRGVDAAVVELRAKTHELLEREIDGLDGLDPGERERTAAALSRFAARLLDVPCRRARSAVAEGRASGYLEGLDLVLGIGHGGRR